MKLFKANFLAVSSAMLLGIPMATVGAPAIAQDTPVVPESVPSATPSTQKAKYLNGGVGDSQTKAMKAEAGNWSLRIVFSQLKANEYISDVKLSITDAAGTPYLSLDTAGPLTYVALPPGKYSVTATYAGQSEKRQITIDGKKSRDLNFHWKGTVKSDPFDGKPLGGSQIPG